MMRITGDGVCMIVQNQESHIALWILDGRHNLQTISFKIRGLDTKKVEKEIESFFLKLILKTLKEFLKDLQNKRKQLRSSLEELKH
jgi:hypothetical protein